VAKKTNDIVWDTAKVLGKKSEGALIDELKAKVRTFCACRKKLDSLKPEGLRKLLLLEEEIAVIKRKLHGYYELRLSVNTKDSDMLAKTAKFSQLATDLSNDMLFFSLWFIHLDEKKAGVFLKSPLLSGYHHYLYEMRKEKPYIRSEEVEKIISLKSLVGAGAHSEIYSLVTSQFKYDFNGKKGLAQEEVVKNFYSKDPELREGAYSLVLQRYKENATVFNELYKNIVLDGTTEDLKIRGFKTPISSQNLSNEIDDRIVETLLKVVRKNVSVFSDYFRLKWKINQKKGPKYEFSRYHIYAPYTVKVTERFDFDKSKNIMLELFSGFSSRFHDAASEILEKRHVHAYPKPNKRSGAFCIGLHNKETPFIMLNHTGTLTDLFTLVHEFGHGVHDSLARKQNNLSYQASIPIAETASIFSEMLLGDKIINDIKDDDEKTAILIKLLDNQFATIIRQAYFVIFEIFAHDSISKGLTREEMNKEYRKLLKEQFGRMKIPSLFDEEWHYVPHIHYSPFYCYSYVWGNLLVLSLFAMYQKEGEKFKDKYLRLLEAGGSKSPVELLKEIGIDPSKEEFWQQGFEVIRKEIEELKRLTN